MDIFLKNIREQKIALSIKLLNHYFRELKIGYILRFLPLSERDIENSLKQQFLGKDLEINLKALKEGIKK